MYITYRKKENHLLEVLLPFLSVLAQYRVALVPLSVMALLIIVIARGKLTISAKCKPFMVFFAYIVIRDVFHMVFSSGEAISAQINHLLEYSATYILIFCVCDKFDEAVLYKWWKIAGFIFGVGMMYHVVQIMFLNNSVVPISIIPGYFSGDNAIRASMRPTSFFVEPAAYVSAMMPLLFLTLKRKDLVWAFITTFMIAVSTSTVGIILSAALWIIFVLFENKSFKSTVFTIALVCILVALFLNMGIFSDALEKLETVASGGSTVGSRIKSPFEIISAMDFEHLPFGNTVLVVRDFVLRNTSKFPSGSAAVLQAANTENVFLNSIAYLIYRYGVVGLFIFLMTFKGKLMNKNYEARMYAIMLIIAAFGQGNVEDPGINTILLILYAIQSSQSKETQAISAKADSQTV